ncbi:MAG: hypothetical protein HZA22_11760 [Nitrospirae bacterium]|nr:hypothetical protein [Nitrospirota bacterium]
MRKAHQTFRCSLARWIAAAIAVAGILAAAGCGGHRVVVARSGQPVPPPPVKTAPAAGKTADQQPKAEPSMPPAKSEEKTKAAASPDASAKTAAARVGTGPKSVPPKPEDRKADAAPQRSPAKPKAEAKESGGEAVPSPYSLDLSFGGFGLGQGLLDTPVSVAVDEQENIYVVDQGNYRIQKFDRFGIFQFAFGRQGMGDGEFAEENDGAGLVLRMTGEFEFNKPVGMILDNDATRDLIRITVVDSLNYRIQRFLLTQDSSATFPDNPLDVNDPVNVFLMMRKLGTAEPDATLMNTYQSEGRQVILDPVYIRKADNILLAPFVWGGLGFTEGKLNLPTYLAMDDKDVLYVTDTENARVQGFFVTPGNQGTDTTFFRQWGNDLNMPYGAGRLNFPTAIAFDNSGYGGFLVLDKLQDGTYSIVRFDRDGEFLGVFATSGDKDGQFREPVNIAVNNFDNTVFVTDRGRKKVMVYNGKGDFIFAFGGDELADPRGITVLRNNYVYVTDAVKNMVYRYVPK